jgi:dolichol-phosphate mannosyltransferase
MVLRGIEARVIVPTFNERDNIPELLGRILASASGNGLDLRVLVVDDSSPDGTAAVVAEESARHGDRVELVTRREDRGLARSVVAGLARTTEPLVVVMDADLSHAPEDIPRLLEPIVAGDADVVIGSRYTQGSAIREEWGALRRANSTVATLLARPLTTAKDPMSGFFAFRRALLERAPPLSPEGYKILLELLVKCRPARVLEVPISFETRHRGKSKLGPREQALYLIHLGRLYDHVNPSWWQLLKFSLVGTMGVLVDTAALTLCVTGAGLRFEIARVISFLVAMSFNFAWNRSWTFRARGGGIARQYVRYAAGAGLSLGLNWTISVGLYSLGGWMTRFYQVPAILGTLGGFYSNYVLVRRFAFGSNGAGSGARRDEPPGSLREVVPETAKQPLRDATRRFPGTKSAR